MKPSLDPTQLQRLVDGECTPADVRAILLAAKNDPVRWEQIALALLEDRAWQCQIQSPPDDSFHLHRATNALTRAQPSTLAKDVTQAQTNPSPRHLSAVVERSSYPLLTWFAMAASLLAVAILGYSIGQHRSNSNPANLVKSPGFNAPSADLLASDRSPRTTLASLPPDYRMQLPASDRLSGGRLQPSGEVPLYVVHSLDQWQELDQPQTLNLTPEELAELNVRGIGVQKDFDVLSGKFDDGRVFLVPIRSIRFSPWQ